MLEGRRLLFIPKNDSCFDSPGTEFRRVRTVAFIVFFQPGREVASHSDVVVVSLLAFEYINVCHRIHGLAKP